MYNPVAALSILTVIWQDVFAIELIKILIGATIGAAVLYFRNLIITMVITTARLLITTPISIFKGLKTLGTKEFIEIPKTLTNLQTSVNDVVGRVGRLEHTVGPNGGKSLLDGIDKLRRMVSSLEFNVSSLVYTMKQIADASGYLMFKVDQYGNLTWASVGLQDLVDFTFEDGFKNQQWENLYFPDDLPDIRRRWYDAMRLSETIDRRPEKLETPEVLLTLITRFRHNTTGDEIPVNIRLTKLPDGTISGIVTKLG